MAKSSVPLSGATETKSQPNPRPSRRGSFTTFLVVWSSILLLAYLYLSFSVAPDSVLLKVALFLPFFSVWIVPIRYWVRDREGGSKWDEWLHASGYLAVGWLNFLLFLALAKDVSMAAMGWLQLESALVWLDQWGPLATWIGSVVALGCGFYGARRGPQIKEVDIHFEQLPAELHGMRWVQISDLHAGPTIGRKFVEGVVESTLRLKPDFIVLTGDIGDGPTARYADTASPLARLGQTGNAFFVTGNHEYYAGGQSWIQCMQNMAIKTLCNEHAILEFQKYPFILGGIVDPAAAIEQRGLGPRLDLARGPTQWHHRNEKPFRVLLAHNPKIAPDAAAVGFDFQLSGHTHAGQFWPWNYVVRLVHAPHVAGLTRQGTMAVYVSAGTGTWGPPIRFGTRTELTVLRFLRT